MDVTGRATQEAKAEGWGEGIHIKHPHPHLLPEGEETKEQNWSIYYE